MIQCRPLAPVAGTATASVPVETQTTAASTANTETPFVSTPTIEITPDTQSSAAKTPYALWLCDCLPEKMRSQIVITDLFQVVDDPELADFQYKPVVPHSANKPLSTSWVYVLAAPFPTIQDSVGLAQIQSLWRGSPVPDGMPRTIILSQSAYNVFAYLWGVPSEKTVKIMPGESLLFETWSANDTWAIVPFEELDPRWKVIRMDGFSPLDGNASSAYPLRVQFALQASSIDMADGYSDDQRFLDLVPETNLDETKLTSLILTGTTALVRYTAFKMEENGVNYPGLDIASTLLDADLTHISNEAPFYDKCPPASPVRLEQRFCSDPAYFSLLEYIDADIIELTGNHIKDWGNEALLFTIQLYENSGTHYYGGGKSLQDARQVLHIEEQGNVFSFIGCSQAGPEPVFATEDSPGSNRCENQWINQEIAEALDKSAIPIVTFQHFEVEDFYPHSSQRVDFLEAAEAGAVIVSGSQSHFAQTMTFVENRFVHYGLGNLFFDQMYGENPKEFIDKHYFYRGKYISTELITAILEDSARPRLMDAAEREDFLRAIFEKCDWSTAFDDR